VDRWGVLHGMECDLCSLEVAENAEEVPESLFHVSEGLDDRLLVKLVQDPNCVNNFIK